MNSYSNKIYRYPLIVAITYLIATVIFFIFGEYVWIIPNLYKLLLFLVAAYFGFWLGGLIGLKNRIRQKWKIVNKITINILFLYRFSCIFSIMAYIIMVNYYGQGFRLTDIFASAGDVYIEKALRVEYDRNYLVQIFSWFWAFTYIYIPIGFIYFRKLTKLDKGLLYITISTCILYWISIGTMKGIGDILIQIIPCYFLNKYQESSNNLKQDVPNAEGNTHLSEYLIKSKKRKPKKRRPNKKQTVLLIIAVLLFLVVFGKLQESREIAIYGKLQSATYLPSTILQFVKNVRSLPFPGVIKSFMYYISHGYTGLAYCLELPFEWTGMIGFSRSLTEIIETRFSLNISSLNYLQRCQDYYGWHNGMLWSTIFPWFAGDVTFYGVPFVMMIIGYMFTSTWKRCLKYYQNRNILDVVLFNQLCILVIFIPCNNQIFQSRQSLFAISLIIVMRIFIQIKTDVLDKKHKTNG